MSLEGKARPLKRAAPAGANLETPHSCRSQARGPQHGNSRSGEREKKKKETQRAIDRETHKQRRALSRQRAADRKRHTEAEEGLRAAAEAELS